MTTNINSGNSKPDSVSLPYSCANKNTNTVDTVINQRYLGESLRNALDKTRVLGVLAPYGCGKTTAIKQIISSMSDDARILFITPRKSLNTAIAGDFEGINCYSDIKQETNKSKKIEAISSMSCTPQSLGALLELADDPHYDLVVFDESEAIASMLTSDVVRDKERTLSALKTVVNASSKVVFMDANYSENSGLLAYILSGIERVAMLINEYKPWSNITVDMIEGDKFDDKKTVVNTLIQEAISRDEHIAVATSSASYANDIYTILTARFPSKLIKLATSETDNTELVSNPDSVADVDVLIYSPSLSVGISFDIDNHFSQVFGVFANEIGTPDPLDAMQSMARVRKPIDEKWTIALDGEKVIYTTHTKELRSADIVNLSLSMNASNKHLIKSNAPVSALQRELIRLYATIRANLIYLKNNYNSMFYNMLYGMNVTINHVIDAVTVDTSIAESIKDNREAQKIASVDAVLNADKLDDEQAKHLKTLQKYGNKLLPSQIKSLERYYIESSFAVDFDKLDDAEKFDVLDKKDKGYISKARKRAQLFAPLVFDKEYVKVRLMGVDNDNKSYLADLTSEYHAYMMIKKLNSYALPMIRILEQMDDVITIEQLAVIEYSHKSLKRSPFYRWVMRNKRDLNIIFPNLVPRNFKSKPALFMSKLLDGLGYTHSSERDTTAKGKRVYIYRAELDHKFDDFYRSQLARGDNWVEITQKSIAELQVLAETLSQDDIRRLRMPHADVQHVKNQLMRLPRAMHEQIMKRYKSKYDVMNPDNKHGINSSVFANLWLDSQVEQHCIS